MYQLMYSNVYIPMIDDHFVIEILNPQMFELSDHN